MGSTGIIPPTQRQRGERLASRLIRQIMDELMEDGADFTRIMLKHRMTSD
jgi:hypothetical protein